jgi:uncharacterized protein YuzE
VANGDEILLATRDPTAARSISTPTAGLHVSYDREADALYRSVGDPARVEFDESVEGHALRYDGDGRLVGLTIIGAPDLRERDEAIVVTPPQLRLERDELAAVLSAA